MESFFSTVKSELADRFASFGAAKMEVFDYIDVFLGRSAGSVPTTRSTTSFSASEEDRTNGDQRQYTCTQADPGQGPLLDGDGAMKFSHVGILRTTGFEGKIDLPHLRVTVSDHHRMFPPASNGCGREDAPVPDLVKTVAHVAFEVDDLQQAKHGKKSSFRRTAQVRSDGRFIKVACAPVEFLQIDRTISRDFEPMVGGRGPPVTQATLLRKKTK